MSRPGIGARLTVTSGRLRGTSYDLPPGRTTIGREGGNGIVLLDRSISREHAVVDTTTGGFLLTDLGSKYGTWVNRQRLHGPREIRDGDVIALGSLELTFHRPAGSTTPGGGGAVGRPATVPASGRLSRGQLTRALIFAAVTGVVAVTIESVLTWVRGIPGPGAWLAVGGVAAAGGIATMLLSLSRDRALRGRDPAAPGRAGDHRPAPPPAPHASPRVPARRGVPTLAVVLTILLVCGVGGVAATAGAQRAVAWVQGQFCPQCERGEQWLVESAGATTGSLQVTVSSVEVNSRVTKVSFTAANSGSSSLTLAASFSQLTVAGQTLQDRPLAGDSDLAAPAGGVAHGEFVYDGVPVRSATEASLSFTQIFGPGQNSLTVAPIPLRAPP